MLDKEYIKNFLVTGNEWYCAGHSAKDDFYGFGLFYYSLAYATKAHDIIVLGSGSGFVPRAFKQAQRDLNIKGRVVLVDGDTGNYGRPDWLDKNSFLRTNFPDIEYKIMLTEHAYIEYVKQDSKFDIIFIDADHTYEGVIMDFENYKHLLKKNGTIFIHDTNGDLPCARIIPYLKQKNLYEVIDFNEFGAGLAMVRIK